MDKNFRILVADDDEAIRSSLAFLLGKAGYKVSTASGPEELIDLVRKKLYGAILLDMNYSYNNTGEEGLELISKIRVFCPDCPVILITAWGSVELAVKGIKAGAYDFISKPWNNRLLLNTIATAIDLQRRTEGSAWEGRVDLDDNFDFSGIIGSSKNLVSLLHKVSMVAPTHAPVLITGESGTGKELLAAAIHNNSPRKSKPFVKVNLGGLSASLFESEMFGHLRGAFTDAYTDRKGRFESADGGTIFLDEIGELDISSQVKLLRVLQEQTFEKLGDSKAITVDVRVVCATNKNLADQVQKGLFREDLLYRINLIHLDLPPLRERITDIPALSAHFLSEAAVAYGSGLKTITKEALDLLKKQDWPGNIRELKNLIDRVVLLHRKEEIDEPELFEALQLEQENKVSQGDKGPASGTTLEGIEIAAIRNALEKHGNNMTKVARELGISRSTLYRKLEKYRLK